MLQAKSKGQNWWKLWVVWADHGHADVGDTIFEGGRMARRCGSYSATYLQWRRTYGQRRILQVPPDSRSALKTW